MSKAPRGGAHDKFVQYRIENQVQEQRLRWATPRADIKRPQGGGTDKKAQSKIENQVQGQGANWVTPSARDGKDAGLRKQPAGRKDGKTRLDLMPRVVLHEENYRGYLNPRWVEILMGVPVGWCDPLWNQDPCSCTNRYDELRLLGNGVVPATAEVAIRTLLARILGDEA